MKNGVVLGVWLANIPHRMRRQHWPVWYWLGAGKRTCLSCSPSGPGRDGRQRAWLPVTLPV